MNSQLENAIQEAMAELDKMSEKQKSDKEKNLEDSDETAETNLTVHRPKTLLRSKTQQSKTKQRLAKVQLENTSSTKSTDTDAHETSIHSSGLKSSTSVMNNPTQLTRLRRSHR